MAPTARLVPDAGAALVGTRIDSAALDRAGSRRECRGATDRRQARNGGGPPRDCRSPYQARGRSRRCPRKGTLTVSRLHIETTVNGEPAE
ncbi:MAG: hypothetical protein QM736_25365 [Vicinamibacterales bacterium]